MTPERILLNLHLSNRFRMDKVALPMGASRTKWINDAIREKLDRDNPETIGATPAVSGEAPAPFDPAKTLEDARKTAKPLDYVGPYTVRYGDNAAFQALAKGRRREMSRKGETVGLEDLLEMVAKSNGMELGETEKREIMAERKAETMDEGDFWGQTEKVRELVKRHTR